MKAHEWHPDKNPEDSFAHLQFAAIKEAYETLTDPVKKDQYLQQRWYEQSLGRKKYGEVVTPLSIYKKLLLLDQYVSQVSTYRLDQFTLSKQIEELIIQDELLIARDVDLNEKIGLVALSISKHLDHIRQVPIAQHIKKLTDSQTVRDQCDAQLKKSANQEKWTLWRPWLLLIGVILVCLAVFVVSRR